MNAHPQKKAWHSTPFSRLIHLLVKWLTPWSYMSGQDGRQRAAIERPSTGDREAWRVRWQTQGQPWRTEPEIDTERQKSLAEQRSITPDIKQSRYPFKDMKLCRADVEWLLATHENGRGPVAWSDESQRGRVGVDLRGADLSQEDLRGLPLACMQGGLTDRELALATEEQRNMVAVRMDKADLIGAQLQKASLRGAQLQGANLRGAHLEEADLYQARLEGAKLTVADLEGANLIDAHLEEADLSFAHLKKAKLTYAKLEGADLSNARLEEANLREAQLKRVNLTEAHLERTELTNAQLEGAKLYDAHLEEADLYQAQLEGADLSFAHLEGAKLYNAQLKRVKFIHAHLERAALYQAHLEEANLREAHLEEASLQEANLERANLQEAHLEGADLRGAQLERVKLINTNLSNKQHIGPRLADVQWSTTNLSVVNWSQVTKLGDEWIAIQKRDPSYGKKGKSIRLDEYKIAVRANRQLAVALQAQGLNEDAARFAYHAQVLQKSVLWYQMTQQRVPFTERMQALGAWLFSWFLFLLAGYGYKPIRSVIAYLVIIFGFMGLYLLNAHCIAPHLTWDEALVLSVSSFHGRGFFTQNVTLGDTYARLAAIEAVVGLFIEISFIATFTQRFLGK